MEASYQGQTDAVNELLAGDADVSLTGQCTNIVLLSSNVVRIIYIPVYIYVLVLMEIHILMVHFKI